jgi:hypothetical protein
MAESLVFNMDCMEGMKQFPDVFLIWLSLTLRMAAARVHNPVM